VFAADKKRQLLVDLPHAGLLQLLRDERTRVASENTAAHAVLEWAIDNDATTEQMQQLVRALLSCIHCQGILCQCSLNCCSAAPPRSAAAAAYSYAAAINS
jgi:hypothetical protein